MTEPRAVSNATVRNSVNSQLPGVSLATSDEALSLWWTRADFPILRAPPDAAAASEPISSDPQNFLGARACFRGRNSDLAPSSPFGRIKCLGADDVRARFAEALP